MHGNSKANFFPNLEIAEFQFLAVWFYGTNLSMTDFGSNSEGGQVKVHQ